MPEFPEVETVARGLQKSVVGRRIVSVRMGKTDFIDDPVAIEQHVPGRQIEAVGRYGKFMLPGLSGLGDGVGGPGDGEWESALVLVEFGSAGQLAPFGRGRR